ALYSQPICTALQITLIHPLLAWGISLSMVVGHSSEEIADAYVVGDISHQCACNLGY
ncbi:hypothetical protein BJ875DRAFT_340967, partial [Amylocarpus encephaloides]